MAMSAGGPAIWSDPAESAFKREQAWNQNQLDAGYRYLLRKSRGGTSEQP
jgi:hypothetical protein